MSINLDVTVIGPVSNVGDVIAKASQVARHGLSRFWVTQGHTVDALSAAQAAATAVPTVGLGTAVLPIQGRHPMVLAQQALTANQAAGGRIVLGLGVSHQPFIEGVWGMSHTRSIAQMTEYLDELLPLLHGDAVDVEGEWWTQRGEISIARAPAPQLFLSALGPKMLDLAGRRADGVITWLVGPKTIEQLTVPTLRDAALDAQRSMPALTIGSPICVTSDAATARARAAAQYGGHGALPAYRSTLDREGVAGPEDLAIIGDRGDVSERLAELVSLGATSIMADVFGDANEQADTFDLLAELHTPVIDLTAEPAPTVDQSTRA